MIIMAMSVVGAWIGVIMAFATDKMGWLWYALAMFVIADFTDRIDDRLRARARRFE